MLQFILNITSRLIEPRAYTEGEHWHSDPLSHPTLRAMSQAELGDLPIGHPHARTAECGC